MKNSFTAGVLLLGLWQGAMAQAASPPPAMGATPLETINVSGIAELHLPPDRAVFTVGIQTSAPTVEAAANANNTSSSQIKQALKKAGVADKEIQTSEFLIMPQQEFREEKRPRIISYQARHSFRVTHDDITNAGKLLQVALDAGANQVSGLSFTLADPLSARAEGLRRAMDDARTKASVLAEAAGRALGRVTSISEGDAAHPIPLMGHREAMMMESATSTVPVEPGTETLHFSILVSFELR